MQTVDQIGGDISDEALEAAGMETAGAWTFICTSGIQCREILGADGHLLCGAASCVLRLESTSKTRWDEGFSRYQPRLRRQRLRDRAD